MITTPNKNHPIETHTGVPLLHYLPAWFYRRIYRLLGKGMYASEETLNLLSSKTMAMLLDQKRTFTMNYVWWFGFKSNIILKIIKND